MNHNELETWILLRESGELDPGRTAELDAALASDPDLRAFADSLQQLGTASRTAGGLLQPALSDWTRERILHEAKPRRYTAMAPLLAAAAAVLLGLSLWQMLPRAGVAPVMIADHQQIPVMSADPVLTDLESLDTRLSALFDLATLDDTVEEDMNSWAEELLAMEGSI